jgi:anti-anti-sigma factor
VLTVETKQTARGYVVCQLAGALAVFTECQLRQSLAEVAEANRLIIDLSAVRCFDVVGLNALVDGIRRACRLGGDVAVVCAADVMVRYLRDAGLERSVMVSKTICDATAVFD